MVTTVFPYTGLLRFLLSPKSQTPSRSMLHTENAKLLTLLFLPGGHLLPRLWVGFRLVMGKLTYYWVLCKNAP